MLGLTLRVLADALGDRGRHAREAVDERRLDRHLLGVLQHLEQHPELDAVRVRLDLLRLARQLVRRARVVMQLALGRPVGELEVRVGDHRLLEVRVDAGAAAAVGADELELDPRAVVVVPLDLLFVEDVGLVFAGVDAKLDLSRGAPLARLREDDDRLAGGELRVQARGADADALLPARLLQR